MLKAILCTLGLIKLCIVKLFHWNRVKISQPVIMYPSVSIQVDKGGLISLGKKVSIRRNCELNVRNKGCLIIGNDSFLNSGCIVTSHKNIVIGDNVEFGPNVLVFDHDHKYKNGYRAKDFECEDIVIGNNVWVGAGTIILRGTRIGDNSIIAAGSVIKGEIPTGSVIIQKRYTVNRNEST